MMEDLCLENQLIVISRSMLQPLVPSRSTTVFLSQFGREMHFFSSENISAPQWSVFQEFFDCCPSRATTVLSVNHRHKIFVTKTKRTGPKDKRPVSVFSRCRNKNFGPDGTRRGGAGGADRSRSPKNQRNQQFLSSRVGRSVFVGDRK